LPGASSPVLWGDRLFLTGATAEREEVYCLDAHTGAMLWKKALVVVGSRGEAVDPLEDTGHAAPTPATDGRHVFALFASGRVAAFDMDGEQAWLRSLGPFENTYGHSSSLALYEDHVLLQLDQGLVDDKLARLVALNATTGKTVWKTPRPVDSSWASPIVCHPPSGPQVVLSATPILAAYDPATGSEIWRADVLYGEVAPTPICHDGVVYVVHENVGLYAVRTDGTGDVTKTHVSWNAPDGAPSVASPLCDGERVYLLTTSGTLTCVRASSGEVVWEHELEADYYASPFLAGRVLYLTSMAGVTTTLRTGDEFEALGNNPLGEGVFASMAFGHGRIYLRGKDHLFAIGEAR
jgi:outer membrane protein assembly factor BamB